MLKKGGDQMALIKTVDTGLYRIPLTVSLSDSTHGNINAFELVTCRVRDSDGAEGVGYTYTVGRNGGAIADALRREIPELIEGREADDTEAIWHQVWWALHYGGRGGPPVLALSALDIAPWDPKAPPALPRCRCFVCSAASTLASPVTPAASTSTSPWRHCCSKPMKISPRAFAL